MTSRRQFVQRMVLGATGPLGVLNLQALMSSAHANSVAHNRRLVLVELAGANDGLNTLVPYQNDLYYKLRPNLGLSAQSILPLTDATALHAQLQPLMPLWESGDMAWIQGLGYPNANRSHFASMALWETAGDGENQRRRNGWITEAVEHQLAHRFTDPHGISMAGDMDIFASDSGRWLSFQSVERLDASLLPDNKTQTTIKHAALALVQSRLNTLEVTLSGLAEKIGTGATVNSFRAGAFGEQLRQVAKLIAAGVQTPVYRVRLEGFDTHQYQLGQHGRLMRTLSEGLADFSTTMKSFSEWDNTLVLTYSEFGRRVGENNSQGTDHGTAAPHMLLGGAVNGGLFGNAPSLSQLVDGDLKYTMDYRAVYRHLLVSGLGIDPQYSFLKTHADSRLRDLVTPV